MADGFLTPLLIGLLFQAAGLWLFFVVYNLGVCSLERSILKRQLQNAAAAVFLVALPAILIGYRHAPWLEPILAAHRLHTAHVVLAVILLYALTCQISVTCRLLRPRRVPNLIALRERRAPYEPSIRDWDVYLREDFTTQPKAGTVPPDCGPDAHGSNAAPVPPYRRRVKSVRSHPLEIRFILSSPFRHIDQTYDLRLVEVELGFPNLPPAFDGLRVLQLTDNHFGEVVSPAWYSHVVRHAGEMRPDLIVLTGDLSGAQNLYRQAVEMMRPLRAPMGVWAIRGNHDFNTEPEVLAYWLERENIRLLPNRHVDFERQGQTLRLIGLEHPYKRLKDWRGLSDQSDQSDPSDPSDQSDPSNPSDQSDSSDPSDPSNSSDLSGGPSVPFRLVLSHTPDNIFRLARAGADLVLSGHTHGGQWRLPVIGPIAFPSRYGRRFTPGLQKIGRTLLYASNGIGVHTIPFRLSCPPEITLFILRTSG
jgi:hypothetical protein